MFGNYKPIGSIKNIPVWIKEIVNDVESLYNFHLHQICFKSAKKIDVYAANYYPNYKVIDLYFCPEKTDLKLWILLHELTHAIQHIAMPYTLTSKPTHRKNRIVHNNKFFQLARELYIIYDVLHIAVKYEYKKARKLMIV